MARIYLEAGRRFELCGAIMRIGGSGTVVDASIDWADSAKYCGDREDSDPGYGDCIGLIYLPAVVNGETVTLTFDVHLDQETSRMWYDDEKHC